MVGIIKRLLRVLAYPFIIVSILFICLCTFLTIFTWILAGKELMTFGFKFLGWNFQFALEGKIE